jgi:glutathione S-transferase
MRLKLYVVHGSHPCAAVEKALQIKGLEYAKVEYPPTLHGPIQRVRFGARTVPSLRIDGTEKISGSRAIMRRLDQLEPSPLLYPADPDERAAVQDAERWGDETFQPVGRTLIWAAFLHDPGAMVSYTEGSKLPLPPFAIRASGPGVARIAARVNRTGDEPARRDLGLLPGYLDTIDGYIAAGTIGDAEHPNAADLQILSTIALLLTIEDVRPLIDGRPCADLARALFPNTPGRLPAGALPAA